MKPISFLFSDHKKWVILLAIAVMIFIQRSPTLFIEFTNNDELAGFVQARDTLHYGKTSFLDDDSARLTKTAFLQVSILLFGGDTTIGMHFSLILLIIATSFTLYLIASLLLNRQAGYLAALFYGIFISGTQEQFMSLKPDIIVNFAILPSFYFFLLYEVKKKEKMIYLILSGIFLTLAALGKQQALIFVGAYGFYYIIMKPLLFKDPLKANIKPYLLILSGFILSFGIVILTLHLNGLLDSFYNRYLYFYIAYHLSGFFTSYHETGYTLQDSSSFIRDFPWKMAFIIATNFIIWFFGFLFVKREVIQQKERLGYLLFFFFLTTYLIFFAGLGRMSFHYMMMNLPFLSLMAAYYLSKNFKDKYQGKRGERWVNLALLIPMILYLAVYYSVITIHHVKPGLLEDRLSGFMVYRKDYRDLRDWLKSNTKKEDTIYLWGNLVEVYYAADRRGIGGFNWGGHILADQEKKIKENKMFYEDSLKIQRWILAEFNAKRLAYFVDASKSKENTYSMPPLNRFSLISKYLNKYFEEKTILANGIRIYQRKTNG